MTPNISTLAEVRNDHFTPLAPTLGKPEPTATDYLLEDRDWTASLITRLASQAKAIADVKARLLKAPGTFDAAGAMGDAYGLLAGLQLLADECAKAKSEAGL